MRPLPANVIANAITILTTGNSAVIAMQRNVLGIKTILTFGFYTPKHS